MSFFDTEGGFVISIAIAIALVIATLGTIALIDYKSNDKVIVDCVKAGGDPKECAEATGEYVRGDD